MFICIDTYFVKNKGPAAKATGPSVCVEMVLLYLDAAEAAATVDVDRLDAAHLLVDEPERTIAQIAADCGFGSSAYFSDRFRQHYGMSPSDFRIEATK